MEHWLQKRLTPAKKKSGRWVGYAQALEQLWEEYFLPNLSRYQRLRSSFQADDADLAKQIAQMGDYFSYDMPQEESRAIALAWRRLELEYKDLELILSMALRRHFGALDIDWLPLFAPVDAVYGTRFEPWGQMPPDSTKNIAPEGWFLTSRGMLGVSLDSIYAQGYNKQQIYSEALPLVKRIKPIHIVFDGFLWYVNFKLQFSASIDVWWERENIDGFLMPFDVYGHYFDTTPADALQLDVHGFSCTWEREDTLIGPAVFLDPAKVWHLDWYAPFSFPDGWLPLDFVLGGYEGEIVGPLRLFYANKDRYFSLPETFAAALDWTGRRDLTPERFFFETGSAWTGERQAPFEISFWTGSRLWRLDWYPPLDLPRGWLPTDFVLAGLENEEALPVRLFYADKARYWELFGQSSFGSSWHGLVDLQPESVRVEPATSGAGQVEDAFTLPFWPTSNLWALDWFAPMDLPAGWIPLDFVLKGVEGETTKPVRLFYADKGRSWSLAALAQSWAGNAEKERSMPIPFFEERQWRLDWQAPDGFPDDWFPLDYVHAGIEGQEDRPCTLFFADRADEQTVLFDHGFDRLDRFLKFDDFPADIFPLDMPVGGFVYA